MNTTEKILQVWDRQEIEQLMYRHARSLDRLDAELMKSTYWPEAVEELEDTITGQYIWNDNAWKFVPIIMDSLKNVKTTKHTISNILINLNGDTATAETYVTSYSVYTDENGIDKESIAGGRHLFKLEKRDEEWRILHRSTIFDLNQNQNATALWTTEYSEKYKSKRDKSDDSYNYLNK